MRTMQRADLRKCEYTVDTPSDLRFFPTPHPRLIHVPVKVSLPAFFRGSR